MDPKELALLKQQLETYRKILGVAKMLEFERAARPPSAAVPEQTPSLRFSDPIRAAIERRDNNFFHECLSGFNKLDPDEYYENLFKKDYVSKEEFLQASERFLSHIRTVDLQDAANNLSLLISHEEELVKQQPQAILEEPTEEPQGQVRQQEEEPPLEEPQPRSEGGEPPSSGQPVRLRQPPPRFVFQRGVAREKTESERQQIKKASEPPKQVAQEAGPAKNAMPQRRETVISSKTRKLPQHPPAQPAAEPYQPSDRMKVSPPAGSTLLNSRNRRKALASLLRGRAGSGFNIPWVPKFLQRWAGQLARGALNLASNLGRAAINGLVRGAAQLLPRLGAQAALQAGRSLLMGAGAAVAGVGLATILFWVIIAVLVGFGIWWLYDSYSECGQPGTVEIVKSAPKDAVRYGEENINYQINIIYKVKCPHGYADAQVRDTLPANTEYVPDSAKSTVSQFGGFYYGDSEGPKGVLEGNTLVWELKALAPNQPNILTFAVTPNQDNIWVVNEATVKFSVIQQQSATFSGNVVDPATIDSNVDFETLMQGQGRNLSVMGNTEEEFMAKLRTNLAGSSIERLVGNDEQKVRQIFRTCTEKQVNPLVCLTVWGTESGWTENKGLQFGCDPYAQIKWNPDGSPPRGFDQQLECASNTWNNNMARFRKFDEDGDGKVQLPSAKGLTCIYDEEFMFAAELYGPVCTKDDGNSNWRKDFAQKYKLLLGVK